MTSFKNDAVQIVQGSVGQMYIDMTEVGASGYNLSQIFGQVHRTLSSVCASKKRTHPSSSVSVLSLEHTQTVHIRTLAMDQPINRSRSISLRSESGGVRGLRGRGATTRITAKGLPATACSTCSTRLPYT